jgi:hypothetical protein
MSAKAEADSTTQKSEVVQRKKLSRSKQLRKESRDLKFNRAGTDTSISEESSQLEDQISKINQVLTNEQDQINTQAKNSSILATRIRLVLVGQLGTRYSTFTSLRTV